MVRWKTQSRTALSWSLSWAALAGAVAQPLTALAQTTDIVPDGSTPTTTFGPDPTFGFGRIDGGEVRGPNLFHSFQTFSIGVGDSAYFIADPAIANIFARITGADASQIFGTLGTAIDFGGIPLPSEASLFLLNPNGLIFGPGAQLDLAGSFVGTTANGVQFGAAGAFSTSDPTLPSALLTVNPTALFYTQLTGGQIENYANTPLGTGPLGLPIQGLRVADGKSLLLLGGNVVFDNGGVNALGGNITLAGLTGPGSVSLAVSGAGIQAALPQGVSRADVTFQNGSQLNVSTSAGGGSATVLANNVTLGQGSLIAAGVGVGSTGTGPAVGDVTLDATGQVSLDGSDVVNITTSGGVGNAGRVQVNARQLSLQNGASITTSNLLAVGNAGDINITVSDALLASSGARINASTLGVGDGGTITVQSGNQIAFSSGAQFRTDVFGLGDAGKISLEATNSISFDGLTNINNVLSPTGAGTEVNTDPANGLPGIGNAGDIEIHTRDLTLSNGAALSSSSLSQGNAGNISIRADRSINLNGNTVYTAINQGVPTQVTATSRIGTTVGPGAVGEGGDITLTAPVINLDNGAQILSVTAGLLSNTTRPDAGDVQLNVGESLSLRGGSSIQSDTFGQGDAGAIAVQGRTATVTLDGATVIDGVAFISGFSSSVQGNPTLTFPQPRQSGPITVEAQSLALLNGAQIRNSLDNGVVGQGADILLRVSGPMVLQGEQVVTLPDGQGNVTPTLLNSLITTNVGLGALGNGGNIDVQAGSLSMSQGASLQTGTSGGSQAANVLANAGNIGVRVTGSLVMTDAAQFRSDTFGFGNAGNIQVEVGDTLQMSGFRESSDSFVPTGMATEVSITPDGLIGIGQGGDIVINARTILLNQGASLSSATFGLGPAGDVILQARDAIALTNGGIIRSDTSSPAGNAGRIALSAGGPITLSGEANLAGTPIGSRITSQTSGPSNGGLIEINGGSVSVQGGGTISGSTLAQGAGGNIVITSAGPVRFEGRSSDDTPTTVGSTAAPGSSGPGGDLRISGGSITIAGGAVVNSATFGPGRGGNLTLSTPGLLQVDTGQVTTLALQSSGGNIDISANQVRLLTDGDITTFVLSGSGGGGNIVINANTVIALNDSDILAFSLEGSGGNITLNTPAFFGENFRPAPPGTNPVDLDLNGRVDVNASGAISSGAIALPDVSFIQNSLNELPSGLVNADQLVAGSCIARTPEGEASLIIAGSDGLPTYPGEPAPATFATGTVQSVPDAAAWQPGDPIQEPTAAVQLADGRLVLSQACRFNPAAENSTPTP